MKVKHTTPIISNDDVLTATIEYHRQGAPSTSYSTLSNNVRQYVITVAGFPNDFNTGMLSRNEVYRLAWTRKGAEKKARKMLKNIRALIATPPETHPARWEIR